MNRKPMLRIAIDCRIVDSQQGVGTAVLALAKAFSESTVADQEYTFIVRDDMTAWLTPHIYGPCHLVGIPLPQLSAWQRFLRSIAPVRYIWGKVRGRIGSIPVSDGYLEAHGFDLVHFPTQVAFITKLRSIYQPWDLQHIHYPEFFSTSEIQLREKYYRTFCEFAECVCVQAEWTKNDIVKHYRLAPEKVKVIPWGSVFDAYQEPSIVTIHATISKYQLPEHFFFYPAVTWPHKNHKVIIEALGILKHDHNRMPNVYFTGTSTEFRGKLEQLAQRLGVSEQIHYLGFLPQEELQSIYRTATAMIFASKFEGFGLPILEAFAAQLPVLSSTASTLPEIAKDAALYFNPASPKELATLMATMLLDPKTRHDLITKGTQVLSQYSMKNTIASFQLLYEQIAARAWVDNRD